MSVYRKELHTAMKLGRDAGGAVMARYLKGNLAVESKGSQGPVTEADRAAHRLITGELAEAFPDDGIVSEEGSDDARRRQGGRNWVVDPLDGTADFISGNGEFSVLIGLVLDGRPVLGVIYQPVGDNLFFAVRGEGAFAEMGGRPPTKLRVTEEADPACMTAVASRNHRTRAVDAALEAVAPARITTYGSVGLKISRIILGEADFYLHPSSRVCLWDTAAPQVILEEAGGVLTDFFGDPLVYDGPDLSHERGIAASNGRAHREILAKVRHLSDMAGLRPPE